MKTMRLWDLPVRIFHWLLVLAVIGSVVSVKTGYMEWHQRFGLTIAGLLSFRLVWGVIGSNYVRFHQFVRGPLAIRDYLTGHWRGAGHNPLGALSVLAMIALFGFQATTGLFAANEVSFEGPLNRAVSGDWADTLSGWHHMMEWWLYGIVALHLLAVAYYSLLRKEELVRPMITGNKTVRDDRLPDRQGGGIIAFLIAVAAALFVVWVASGALLPPPPPPPPDLGW